MVVATNAPRQRAETAVFRLRSQGHADAALGVRCVTIDHREGRMLFVAAEYPFHEVLGVEFATELHEIARTNIQAFKHRKQRCTNIASININAADFDFPNRNLAVYIFNPFGPEVMKLVLENLARSIASHPRHVVILLLWPEQSHMVAEMPGMNPYRKTRRYDIYQTCEGAKH